MAGSGPTKPDGSLDTKAVTWADLQDRDTYLAFLKQGFKEAIEQVVADDRASHRATKAAE